MASGSLRHSIQAATAPTSSDLAMALASSTSDCEENIRPRPLSGDRRVKSGVSSLVENIQPPKASGASRAATPKINSSGRNTSRQSHTTTANWDSMRLVSNAVAGSNARLACIAILSSRPSVPPNSHSVATPVMSITKVPSSRERTTCPSSRAFSRRRGVAGSVFSRSLSSDMDAPIRSARTALRHHGLSNPGRAAIRRKREGNRGLFQE